MKIYEIIRKKQAQCRAAEYICNRDVTDILKKWFPEYEINYSCDDVVFSEGDYWCRFLLYGAETYSGQVTNPSTFRLSRNNGFTKKEIQSIKERLTKLYEGACEDGKLNSFKTRI